MDVPLRRFLVAFGIYILSCGIGAIIVNKTAHTPPEILDIHILVGPLVESAAINANERLSSILPDQQIDLRVVSLPHITLYLTEFDGSHLEGLLDTLSGIVPKLSPQCKVTMGQVVASSTYTMWNVIVTPCLQEMSDIIVNATKGYAVPNQTPPDWVYSLPEPQRTDAIRLVAQYGSPGVFENFQPHVTLGWDKNASALAEATQTLKLEPLVFVATQIAIGHTGDYGTVTRGGALRIFDIGK